MRNGSIGKDNSTPTSHAFSLCGDEKKTIYMLIPDELCHNYNK